MRAYKILVSVGPGETRIATLHNGKLIGLTIERAGQQGMEGDIFIGRVDAVLKPLQAAFVNIGENVPGFLELGKELPNGITSKKPINDYVSEGDFILVQVVKNPEGNKGAKLSLKPVLTGRYLVFTPGRQKLTISRRIKNTKERNRLTNILSDRDITQGGFILRTAAENAAPEDLLLEAIKLENKWSDIQLAFKVACHPQILMREIPSIQCIIRDFSLENLDTISTDDLKTYNQLRTYAAAEMPDVRGLIRHYRAKEPLFNAEGVEEMIEAALDPVVKLPNGGNITIIETEALVAVDVNTGSSNIGNRNQMIKAVNCEAAEAFAEQMQLRNLGGLIVIDFVNMRNPKHREDVLNSLRRAVSNDPQQTFIGGFTRFGLVEITRHRKGESLTALLCGKLAPPDKTALTIGLEALRRIVEESSNTPTAHLTLEISEEMLPIFERDLRTAFAAVKNRVGNKFQLKGCKFMKPNTYCIQNKPRR